MVASAVAAVVVAPSVAVAAPVAVAVVAVVAASAADGDKPLPASKPLPTSPKGRRCLTGFPEGMRIVSENHPNLSERGGESKVIIPKLLP